MNLENSFASNSGTHIKPVVVKNRNHYLACLPDLHRLIISRRSNTLSIRRPCYSMHTTRMTMVSKDIAAIRGIPDLHRTIITPRSDAPPIRGPSYGIHNIRMTIISENTARCISIPDLNGLITAPRGNALSIRRPCHAIYCVRMTPIGIENSSYWWFLRENEPGNTPTCYNYSGQTYQNCTS
jgi:hypothetical protein